MATLCITTHCTGKGGGWGWAFRTEPCTHTRCGQREEGAGPGTCRGCAARRLSGQKQGRERREQAGPRAPLLSKLLPNPGAPLPSNPEPALGYLPLCEAPTANMDFAPRGPQPGGREPSTVREGRLRGGQPSSSWSGWPLEGSSPLTCSSPSWCQQGLLSLTALGRGLPASSKFWGWLAVLGL